MKKGSSSLILVAALLFVAGAAEPGWSHQLPEGAEKLAKSADCADCHAGIYAEWKASMHANSTPFRDSAHNAVRLKNSEAMVQMGKAPAYHCANCHTPMADNIADLISGKAAPDATNWTHDEGIGCAFCHRIEGIVPGKAFDQYALNKDGAMNAAAVSGKSPHKTAKSPLFENGEVCMGCHSHMLNGKGAAICVMSDEGASNCLNCHMNEVEGAPATDSARKSHFSHALPGGHDSEFLKKAVTLDLQVDAAADANKVTVTLKNISGHTFPSTQPMRLVFVKLTAEDASGKVLWTNFKENPTEDMQAVLLKMFKAGEEKGVPPWKAEGVATDTRLKKDEERKLVYSVPAENVKSISAALVYRLFAPPVMKMMDIPFDGKNDLVSVVAKKKVEL